MNDESKIATAVGGALRNIRACSPWPCGAGGAPGQHITISGAVYDLSGRPIACAWLDFWQADSAGRYDNDGFQFRGHQLTDAAGHYVLKTVIPGT